MPSAAANSTDHEQIAALLSLGRMAVLVRQTHNKEAVAGVAAVVVSHVTEVCSAPLHVPNSTLVKLLECSMMDSKCCTGQQSKSNLHPGCQSCTPVYMHGIWNVSNIL
jgi:hypothetical protein